MGKQHILVLCFVMFALCSQAQPIALHPGNPHYFTYGGKPTILVTSGEHYGAVLNLDVDYVTYLKTLKADRLNLTRLFTGVYVEPPGAFNITRNTLAPDPGRYIGPWARSKVPGYANGGNKFDLAQWDTAYFVRLKAFMAFAEKCGVIVELALFCPFYEDAQWKLSPLHAANNINQTGEFKNTDVYTLDRSGKLLQVQEKLVRKIVHELAGFNNLIYEICNEPYFGGVTLDWQHHIADIIVAEEKQFPNKHLISQNIANGSAAILAPHPAVSIFNFHYGAPPHAVAKNYHLNKVIGDNETGFAGNKDSTYRREGWQFLLAGGALYNNLDYSFTVGHEQGDFQYPSTQPGGGSVALRKQLAYLHDFLSGFDYINMKPDSSLVIGDGQSIQTVYALAEQGKQYACYFAAGTKGQVALSIPKGHYKLVWMDPITGKRTPVEKREHAGGKLVLNIPAFKEDAALSIIGSKYIKLYTPK